MKFEPLTESHMDVVSMAESIFELALFSYFIVAAMEAYLNFYFQVFFLSRASFLSKCISGEI